MNERITCIKLDFLISNEFKILNISSMVRRIFQIDLTKIKSNNLSILEYIPDL